MTPIGFFARQSLHARAGNRGQATALFLVIAGALLTLVFASIRLHNVLVARVACADAVDAVALSGATWEARSLNMISALNDGVTQCLRVIRWTAVAWAALAVAAAFGVGLPAFLEYSRHARTLISGYWETAHRLAAWSEKVRAAAPHLVLAETAHLSRDRNVVGMPFPWNPRGPHDGENTLELHLEPAPPITLADAIAPLSDALRRISKVRFLKGPAKAVASVLQGALNGLDRTGKGPIRLLVPEKDFPERQFVRFFGTCTVPLLPIPLLASDGAATLTAESQAEPYGGSALEPRWRSRLTERSSR